MATIKIKFKFNSTMPMDIRFTQQVPDKSIGIADAQRILLDVADDVSRCRQFLAYADVHHPHLDVKETLVRFFGADRVGVSHYARGKRVWKASYIWVYEED